MAKIRIIIEIEEEALQDLSKIWEAEYGVPMESSAEALEALIKEGASSVNFDSPHLNEMELTQLEEA